MYPINYQNYDKNEKKKLTECKCPECQKISKHGYRRWKHLCSDWKIRAIHNKWVMEQEEKISKEFMKQGWDAYEEFINKMMEKSSLKNLWEFIKSTKERYF